MRSLLIAVSVLGALVGGITVAASQSSDWKVPEEARAKKNPVEKTPEAIETGKTLFQKHCVMCHGESGKGDGPATQFIKPAPHDITTPEVRERLTDGEIFYKMTVGKKPMPPMERKMSEEERWKVVHYVRTLQQS